MTAINSALPARSATLVNHQPQVRIGDAERSEVVELLGAHFAAGRLDHAEFERRVNTALAAVTLHEVGNVLQDLPVLDTPAVVTPKRTTLTSDAAATIVGVGLFLGLPALLMMLLGSLALGIHITAFSLVGGGIAMFCGFGFTWLSLHNRQCAPPAAVEQR